MIMLAAASCSGQGAKSAGEEPQGAFYTGVYHNYFSEVLGVSQEEVDQRMDDLWKHFFTPGDLPGGEGGEGGKHDTEPKFSEMLSFLNMLLL